MNGSLPPPKGQGSCLAILAIFNLDFNEWERN